MNDDRTPDWERPLAEVEAAVTACLAALDRYENAFAPVLDTSPRPLTRIAPPLDAFPDAEWDRHLEAARDSTNHVERLLADQETDWAHWREAFTTWRGGIEQTTPPST